MIVNLDTQRLSILDDGRAFLAGSSQFEFTLRGREDAGVDALHGTLSAPAARKPSTKRVKSTTAPLGEWPKWSQL